MKHYIYKIICIVTGKYYYGMHSTANLYDGYFGSGKILGNSVRKHGQNNHLLEILEYLPDRNSLKQREKEIVTEDLIKDPLCMNLKVGGEGGSEKGIFRSEETKAKISIAKKGTAQSLKHRENNAKSRRGKQLSTITKERMSASKIGKKLPQFSEEHLQKLSDARKKRIISEETKLKTSESLKGNKNGLGWKPSEEQKMKQKDALIGKPKQKVECPHCHKIGGKPAMIRFHFDNCKEIS